MRRIHVMHNQKASPSRENGKIQFAVVNPTNNEVLSIHATESEAHQKSSDLTRVMTCAPELPKGAQTMNEVRIGRFLSRFALDNETLRQGVKDYRSFRIVYYCDADGHPMHRMCSVETPSDRNWVEHNQAIATVMTLLSEGEKSIRTKAEVERVAAGVKPVSLAQASEWPTVS